MAVKNKATKLQYQIAFEYRSLKWLVLEIAMFSVFFQLAYMYFKVQGDISNEDIYFHKFISGGLWEIIFYITLLLGFIGVAYTVFGDKKNFYGLYALRTMPIENKDILISKLFTSIVAMLGIYSAQLLSFVFAWSIFSEKIPSAKRVQNALNYALVKDNFIYACFPKNIGYLLVNIIAIIILVIGFSFLFYAVKTERSSKILLAGFYFIINIVFVLILVFIKVRIPFVPAVASDVTANSSIPLVIATIAYFAVLVLTVTKMYKEFIYE